MQEYNIGCELIAALLTFEPQMVYLNLFTQILPNYNLTNLIFYRKIDHFISEFKIKSG